jgi:hypothetical protein
MTDIMAYEEKFRERVINYKDEGIHLPRFMRHLALTRGVIMTGKRNPEKKGSSGTVIPKAARGK